MGFGGSLKVDVGGAVNGVSDAAKSVQDTAGSAVDQAKESAGSAVDQVKSSAEDIALQAEAAVQKVSAEMQAAIDSANEKIAAAQTAAAEMKENCLAAKEKFQGSIAPTDGWKPTSSSSAQLSIGKSFSQSTGITLGNGSFKLSDALTVVFEEDPEGLDKQDDVFVLFSTDKAETYHQEKTVKDDVKKRDKKLTLLFEGLDQSLNYSLRVDSGGGVSYFFFENRPYGDWMGEDAGTTFRISFEIDPNDVSCADDTFTLQSTDGSYEQVKTVKDDLIAGNNKMDLLFDGVDSSLSYSLKIDPGSGGSPYFIFENKPYGSW